MTGLDAIFDGLLGVLIVTLAWGALFHRHLFAGVVLFIVYGLLLAVAWLRLDAPDVALAEAAIGAGIAGVLLIGTVARLGAMTRDHRQRRERMNGEEP